MTDRRVELHVVDWADVPFREAVERAWSALRRDGVEGEGAEVAARLESRIRAAGYPRASVEARQSVSEAIAGECHLDVALGSPATRH